MQVINRFIYSLILVFFSFFGVSQTVNIGDATITQGTIFSTVSDFDNTSTGNFINNGDAYIYANWNNDGVVDFDASIEGTPNGLTRFIGALPQQLSGSQISYFNNILFNNNSAQPAFALSSSISVATDSDYTFGIVDNDNFGGIFIFENNAIDLNTSDDSHVDGSVVKIGDTAFNYPIGDGGFYRFSGISSPNLNTDEFTSKYFFESTDLNYPVNNLSGDLTLIDNAEYWNVERTGGSSNVRITLSWDVDTTPANILNGSLTDIRIARWDATSNLWVNEGGVVDVATQTVTTEVNVDEYGVFTLAKIATERPCGLTIVNNLITPNGDTINDFFNIEYNIDDGCISSVDVVIYDRWGVKIFETKDYGQNANVFNGYSDGRMTISKNNLLPTGTYFYVLDVDYRDSDNNILSFEEANYLYLNGE